MSDLLTLPEAQNILRDALPIGRRLHTVDADGLCLFHCLQSVCPGADVRELQIAADCEPDEWGDEDNLQLLADALGLRVIVWPIDLLAFDRGLQKEFKREYGPDGELELQLVHWCRDGVGLHFDILDDAPVGRLPDEASSFSSSSTSASESESEESSVGSGVALTLRGKSTDGASHGPAASGSAWILQGQGGGVDETEGVCARGTPNDLSPEASSDSESEGERREGVWFDKVVFPREPSVSVEADQWLACAQRLATHLRDRPTMPASKECPEVSWAPGDLSARLSRYACPFKSCLFATDSRVEFLRHVGSDRSPHSSVIHGICSKFLAWFTPLDFVHFAASTLERDRIPVVGPATTRRSLRTLKSRFCDSKVRALICFVCGQIHSTAAGPDCLDRGTGEVRNGRRDIAYHNRNWLLKCEAECPGTLVNNCGYELWRKRYVATCHNENAPPGHPTPLSRVQPGSNDCCGGAYDRSEWVVRLPHDLHSGVPPGNHTDLFGVTEDICCSSDPSLHANELKSAQRCRTLCEQCMVPICNTCKHGLTTYVGNTRYRKSTVPMSLSNDNFYAYAHKLLVEKKVTWLECAASSLVWTTIMVYYLEAPYGHLMLEPMEGAQARTQARGNLFSFSLPWEDIEQRCIDANINWKKAVEASRKSMALPHDESVLAALVHVHVIGGNEEVMKSLEGATMRTDVVLSLIGELRESGYGGYSSACNGQTAVEDRMRKLYGDKYGAGPFIPQKIEEAIKRAHETRLRGASLIWDKNATPSEPLSAVSQLEKTLRPLNIVAQRSSSGAAASTEEHGNVLARYQTLEFATGGELIKQWHPEYLGLAYPFTLPCAVGGYDVPGKPRWRRPDVSAITEGGEPGVPPSTDPPEAAAAEVKLADLVRGLPRRCEAQYRRQWSFVPGLWNLYFREQLNLGMSLSAASRAAASEPGVPIEQDAAMAAAELYKKLQTGTYVSREGKRRRIDGDMTKLPFATGISPQQRRLLSDFRFRTRKIPGTQEIRTSIGHVCFWGSVVYGNGIFMTVTPGERHNYLAIRLSRYRAKDPYIQFSHEDCEQKQWIGADAPSLEARSTDTFSVEVPGYDLRRLIQARDPLAVAMAFSVQIRVILSTLLGIRMCPDCPHCAETSTPCSDAFGSNAELMGGGNGRSDGLCGAVECQKSSGTLHLHFWNFVQRAHQFHNLEEIAALLHSKLIASEELKRFCSELCCESYPSEAKAAKDLPSVEERWPRFEEEDAQYTWGEARHGRVAPFVWTDEGPTYESLPKASEPGSLPASLTEDAARYAEHFDTALQENQYCAQHHMHKSFGKDGKRKIPNACLNSRCKDVCKHDFPKDNLINRGPPLLMCKGLIKKWNLKYRGSRSMHGRYLGTRNNPWLNGTSRALCVGMPGSNTDVKINDLVPIVPETHEDTACDRKCVPVDLHARSRALRRMTLTMQITQAQRNGYFGGYISKRQKASKLEVKKCVDKMHTLRERQHGKSQKQAQRAVSGRMITDIETNGTLRGAVEEFQLCINLRSNDVLFAECIRTFSTVHVDAQRWLHRLEVETLAMRGLASQTFVPPTKKPNFRSRGSKAPMLDIYAFRPLHGTPFALLSPFEFHQYWTAEALVAPSVFDKNIRTKWTPAGNLFRKEHRFADGDEKVLPGVHYQVIEPLGEEYFTFPTEPEKVFGRIRHNFVIVRRRIPHVPLLEGAPLPSPVRAKEASAKYFSVFFRPWTLLDRKHDGVPHLSLLGIPANKLEEFGAATKRLRAKSSARRGVATVEDIDFVESWNQYIHTGIVSQHSAKIIRSVLTACMAKSSEHEEEHEEADKSDVDEEIPPLILGPEDFRRLLTRGANNRDVTASQEAGAAGASPAGPKGQPKRVTHNAALRLVNKLWEQPDEAVGQSQKGPLGPMHFNSVAAHLAAKNSVEEEGDAAFPYREGNVPHATLYGTPPEDRLRRWLRELQGRKESPTAEQAAFLESLVERLVAEAREEQLQSQAKSASEPMLDMVHGVPGAGKSRLIAWVREAFETQLGWKHGVQFVCLAFQNAMAAAIGGFTIHHWTGISIGETAGTGPSRDLSKLSTQCQCMRFILFDEVSMVAAELIGQTEHLVSKVVRKRSGYKFRPDRSPRKFGGVNTIFFGDLWQLKPVGGTPLCSDPRLTKSTVAENGMDLFWGPFPDAVHRCWEVTQSMRCDDKWYNQFLAECRSGSLQDASYNFFHGFPTSAPASKVHGALSDTRCTLFASDLKCKCGEKKMYNGYWQPWVERFLARGCSGREIVAQECEACASVRRLRRRVLQDSDTNRLELREAPFDKAPALFAYNIPRYYTLIMRAREFARVNNLKLF